MKRFQFRLDTLLKFRIIEEEQAQIVLSAAIRELYTQQQQLTGLQNNLQYAFCDFPIKDKQFTINELQLYQQYIDNLKEQVVRQQQSVHESKIKRDESLKIFEEAAKKRKLVEKLKTKRMQEHQSIMLQEEQKFLDEIAGQISFRKTR